MSPGLVACSSPHAAGGVPRARRDRDPRVRRVIGAGGAAPPRDARGAARRRTAGAPPGGRGRARAPRGPVTLALGSSPDLDRAGEADRQGLGGAPGSNGQRRPGAESAGSTASVRPSTATTRTDVPERDRSSPALPEFAEDADLADGGEGRGHLADRADQVLEPVSTLTRRIRRCQ